MPENIEFGPEFQVNTTSQNAQFASASAALTDGRFVVCWSDLSEEEGDTSGYAVRAQIYNADGSASGAEFVVNSYTKWAQDAPSVSALSDGRFIMAWQNQTKNYVKEIRAQIFDADGLPTGAEFVVNGTESQNKFQPEVITLSNGGFVIAWVDHNETIISDMGAQPSNIVAKIYDADGVNTGGEFTVNASTYGYQSQIAMTALEKGRFVATWYDDGAVDADGEADIRAQIFDRQGQEIGAEFVVNTTLSGSQAHPAIATLADGRFVVAWTDFSESGVDSDTSSVRGQIFEADGTKVGEELTLNTTQRFGQSSPTVTSLPDGRFVVTWSDGSWSEDDRDGSAVRGQVFLADGTKSGDEFLVNETTQGYQWNGSISALADGRIVVTWDHYFEGADYYETFKAEQEEVFARIIDPRETGMTIVGTASDDQLIGTSYRDRIIGGIGDDTLIGAGGKDKIFAGFGRDRIEGGTGADLLDGDQGNDAVLGGKGDDLLYGDYGRDRLNGGAGNDTLIGGADKDILIGGKGADQFVFVKAADSSPVAEKHDVIKDFSQLDGDRIVLTEVLSSAASTGGMFLGEGAFTGDAGQVRVDIIGDNTVIKVDLDGDQSTDLAIALQGHFSLTNEDFIF